MYQIELNNLPNQEFICQLDGQNCRIHLRQIGDYLYLTLYVNDEMVCSNVICEDCVKIPTFPTSKFKGTFICSDNLGNSDPSYDHLEDRFFLFYVTEDELKNGIQTNI